MRLLRSDSMKNGGPEIFTRLFHQQKPQPEIITAPPDRTVLSGGRHLRHELKYIIDGGTYMYLRNRLLPLMKPDAHSGDSGYRVTSIYFDDVYNSGYWQKLNGAEFRRKFRIRAYGLDPSFVSLEAKHKDGQFISKLSKRLTDEQYRALLRGDCSFMSEHEGEEDVFGEYYRTDRVMKLRPRVVVDYQREALVYPFGNVRITFDRKLSACFNTMDIFAQGAQYTRIYDKEMILEVKFDNYIPDSIQAALQCINAPMQPVSKYIICTDRMLEVRHYG